MALRTWISGPQREFSGPGSQDLGFSFRTWISGPGFQALDARFQDLALRTWVSGPQKLSILRSSYHFLITFLCVHRHFSFSHHFSLRPPSLFSTSSGHRHTHGRSEFIYKIHTLYLLPTRLNLGSRLILNKRKARYCWNTSTWNCCIPPLMNQHHHSYHLMLPLDILKCRCGISLGPFNSRSLLKNSSSPYWYTDGYLSNVGQSSQPGCGKCNTKNGRNF